MKATIGVLLCAGMFLSGCASNEGGGSNKLTVAVSFANAVSYAAKMANAPILMTLPPSSYCTGMETEEAYGTMAGLDCDNDGGRVAYQTPYSYQIAFKSLYLESGGTRQYLIQNSRLRDITSSSFLSFTSQSNQISYQFTPPSSSFSATKVGFEIYYVQVKIIMYGQEKTLRIYFSDDNFASEGSLGHHQGDITYFDSSGREHWANGGSNWFSDASQTLTRGSFANGIGGTDPQTGHARGMFGNAAFWNLPAFLQGSSTDVFVSEAELPRASNLVMLTLDVSNTWFYENFDDTYSRSFDPCQNGSQEACGGEWGPQLPNTEAASY